MQYKNKVFKLTAQSMHETTSPCTVVHCCSLYLSLHSVGLRRKTILIQDKITGNHGRAYRANLMKRFGCFEVNFHIQRHIYRYNIDNLMNELTQRIANAQMKYESLIQHCSPSVQDGIDIHLGFKSHFIG